MQPIDKKTAKSLIWLYLPTTAFMFALSHSWWSLIAYPVVCLGIGILGVILWVYKIYRP
jgi:hypothetical protein